MADNSRHSARHQGSSGRRSLQSCRSPFRCRSRPYRQLEMRQAIGANHLRMTAEGDLLVTVWPAAVMCVEIKQVEVKRLDCLAIHFHDLSRWRGLPRISRQRGIAFGSRRIFRRGLGRGRNSQPLTTPDHGIARERNSEQFVYLLSTLAIGQPISDECAQGFGLLVRPDCEMPHIPQSPLVRPDLSLKLQRHFVP